MPIFYGADIDEDQVRTATQGCTVFKAGCVRRLIDLEQDLFLRDLGEVEALGVKVLAHLHQPRLLVVTYSALS